VDFNLTEEQQMLRDSARRFVQEHYRIEQRRAVSKTELGFSLEHWRSMSDLGWLALAVPEELGGLGCSFVELALLLEEFGRGLVLEPYVSSAVVCGHILDKCDNAPARAATLSAMAEGRRRLALAYQESAQRYELMPVSVEAKRQAEGFFRLNGVKTLVLDAPAAEQFIVSARVEGEENFSMFLVDRAAAGVKLEAYPLVDDSHAADIELDNVLVPRSALLTGPARSLPVLEEALDRATLACAAEALGAMEAVLQLTAEYLRTRVQFGQPIGKLQALQHRMAEMFVEVQEVRSILYCGIAHLNAEASVRGPVISAAKMVTLEAARIVGSQGVQLHGGIGMTDEYAMGHYFKKLLAFEKTYGDGDWHAERLARPSRAAP
jgi:alkylation response protein AidB-like acyl-CoA dehydrogenase